jgi:hypothetical protein
MVERSRRKKEAEMNEKTSRMVFATAALAAVAAVLAGPGGAQTPEGNGVQPVAAQSDEQQAQGRTLGATQAEQGLDMAIRTAIDARSSEQSQVGQTIPYLSQGVGVDESQFAGKTSGQLTGVHAALAGRSESVSTAALPHGIQVVLSPPSESQTLGLTGDSPLSRVSAPEPEGLTGDSALTRVPGNPTSTPTFSGGEDFDWTSFGAGAGMVALVAAGIVGILLTARRRHTIGLP